MGGDELASPTNNSGNCRGCCDQATNAGRVRAAKPVDRSSAVKLAQTVISGMAPGCNSRPRKVVGEVVATGDDAMTVPDYDAPIGLGRSYASD